MYYWAIIVGAILSIVALVGAIIFVIWIAVKERGLPRGR